ncbi:MAG: ribose-phosphate pyrophosphokinase [Planctomycetes bacterium]|nr:ribose-phosphate pyrophosphokinase [Planctomycetota bacterium]
MYAICHTLHNNLIRIEPEEFTFPGGEVQVTWPVGSLRGANRIQLVASLTNSNDILAMIMGVDAIRRATFHQPAIELIIPYFPYARQDRVCVEGQSLSAAVMASLINNLQCERVTICDPHSDVTGALINNVNIVSQADIARRNKKFRRNLYRRDTIIVAPDAGASKKAEMVASACERGTPVVQAFKHRDLKTGNITQTTLMGSVKGKRCVIVDDICDGGRTFVELAKVLRDGGATHVDLFVTHGIFSKGLSVFDGLINHIFTTDSLPQRHDVPADITFTVQPLSLA